MDDWQDLALNNRRIPHGRLGKRGKGAHAAVFDPKNAFGTYAFDRAASGNKNKTNDIGNDDGVLEIHGFDETEQGFFCSFRLAGNLQGVMLMAGSRKVLKQIVEEADRHSEDEAHEEDSKIDVEDEPSLEETQRGEESNNEADESEESDMNSQESEGDSTEDAEDRERRRSAAFQKNSFRSPKFWIRWRGKVSFGATSTLDSSQSIAEENTAYLIFSKNDCRSFSGTITSEHLGWNNASISGRKIKTSVASASASWSQV